MAESTQEPFASDEVVSLYRRYRPGTFAALRGQEHVVKALKSAVRDDHVAHAYLFSGPRGTGKTSTARILAKALNCQNAVDGEPCGVCSSCIEITKGTSMDVIELDAASNNGVDAIRDIVSHAALGSPGRHKVYIVDEVHMLSNAASNALLKTLEEPPGHVVFVLATTDPQKVSATIRSRVQHLEFRLLGAETLEQLLKDVRDDAHLALDDEALGVVVRRGKGSARDALSALEQVAAIGDAGDVRPTFAELIEGLCDEDASRALSALAVLHVSGWGPQQLCADLIDDLRQGFLLLVSPDLSEAAGAERERLGDQAKRMGLARLVRSIETLGRSMVEMRDAADPQVVLEVAIVRSARTDLSHGAAGLEERLARLERQVAELSQRPAGTAPAPTPTPSPVPPPPVVPSEPGKRPSLGAYRAAPTAAAPVAEPAPEVTSNPEEAPPATPAPVGATDVSLHDIEAIWQSGVLGQLRGATKAMYQAGRLLSVNGTTVRLEVPSDPHRDKCLAAKSKVEAAMKAATGQALTLEIVVDRPSSSSPPPPPSPASPPPPPEPSDEVFDEADAIDVEDLTEAPASAVANHAADTILKAFPGAMPEDGA